MRRLVERARRRRRPEAVFGEVFLADLTAHDLKVDPVLSTSGAQVVGGHESVPSRAVRRFSIRSSTTTAGKHSPSSRDTTGRNSFATSTRYCTRSRVAAYASRDSRA